MEAQNTETVNKAGAKLVIAAGKEELQTVPVEDGMIIGSEQGEGILFLASEVVARMHGKFVKEEDGFYYEDLGGRSGTYYNGVRIGTGPLLGRSRVRLEEGDVLRIEGDMLSGSSPEDTTVTLVYHKKLGTQIEWRSVALSERGSKYYISRHEETVGDDEAFVENETIPELPAHRAILLYDKKRWVVHDDNTRHGVFVNNQKISADTVLEEKDVIRIGNTMFLFRGEKLYYSHRESSQNKLMIHIEERSVWNLFRKKILLEDIDLTISPGEMVLILGGSGAGKTTFINAVMGYEKAKGTIREGDRDIYRDYNEMKYEIGFVPQQDLLRGDDTVFDTLDNAAELKLPKHVTKEEREQRIDQVLEMFGLELEKENMVEKLSGGQRKRLSIAVEFIADPSLFFLDEPDSGLDGIMARSLMENLRNIADQQKIVIVITHAPDRVSDLFDKVVVLAKSSEDNAGHLAFYGLIDEAKDFFGTETLEGVVKRINRVDEGGEGKADEFIEKFEAMEAK